MIIQNAIKITENHPDEFFLVSTHVHDFKLYTFKNSHTVFVDGGNEYIRRGGTVLGASDFGETKGSTVIGKYTGYGTDWVEWCLDDTEPFYTVKDRLLWGTRGKDGKQPLKYVRLATCDVDHLQAILDYKSAYDGTKLNLSDIYVKVIKSLITEKNQKMMDVIKKNR